MFVRSLFFPVACFLLALSSVAAEAVHVKAKPLTGAIGTQKMEGAVADLEGNFYFCNMAAEGLDTRTQGNIGFIAPGGKAQVFLTLPDGMRGNGLRIGPDGALYLADQQGGRVVKINRDTKEITTLHDFGFADLFWNNALNDLAFSKDGEQLYVSAMKNGVWRMNRDGTDVVQVTDSYANGVEISPDGKALILATGFYAIHDDGTVTPTGNKPDLPQENYAYTDGLRCDVEGNIYISRAGAKNKQMGTQSPGAVQVFSPDGQWIKNIAVDHSRVHNVGFGGEDGRTLFLICPGEDGFVATYENDIPGLNQQRLRDWGDGQ